MSLSPNKISTHIPSFPICSMFAVPKIRNYIIGIYNGKFAPVIQYTKITTNQKF